MSAVFRDEGQFYVLSWYDDGSGQPQLRFFSSAQGCEGASYAALEAAAGKLVIVRLTGSDALPSQP